MFLNIIKYLILSLMLVCSLILVVKLFKNGKPLRTLFWSGTSGVISLFLVYLIGKLTVSMISINIYSILCAFGLGVPGVILMVIIHNIWGI